MLKILLAEDNPDVREMIAEQLIRRGYAVLEASDGQEALDCVAREQPALLVLDVGMPALDGLEVTRRLKADEVLRQIPIMILTAHAYAEDLAKARAAGCDAYLSKPVNFALFFQEIQTLLAARGD